MEDATIAELNLPDGLAIFGVFDGHGGKKPFQGNFFAYRIGGRLIRQEVLC